MFQNYPTSTTVVNEDIEDFAFVWRIVNFTAISDIELVENNYESRVGTDFVTGHTEDRRTKWKLSMHANYCPQRLTSKSFVSFYLYRKGTVCSSMNKLKGKLSILPSDKKPPTQKVFSADFSYSRKSDWSLSSLITFVDRNSLLESADVFLPNNTLSVLCEMKMTYDYSLKDDPFTELSPLKTQISASNFIVAMQNLLKSTQHSDVVLRCDGTDFTAHKLILAVRSPVFSRMFNHDMAENKTNVVCIQDITRDVMKLFLSYVYGHDVELILIKNCIGLYAAADKYELHDLKKQCSHILTANLNADNFSDVATLADSHNDAELFSATQRFVKLNLHQLLIFKKWFEFAEKNPVLAKKF